MTLVVAPAGYGKTVAVELWLAERGHAAAWVRADARDDDPMRLWSSLATAVERVRPGAGSDALAKLRDPAGVVLPAIEALAIGLAADESPIVLVVDDVQSIGDARCLRSLDHAVASLPERVQLVLISRTVPPLRLARLRTQGQLVEIGADDLACTVAEAQQLFAAVPGVSADEATVAALTARTEGWAGVLYLAALWLRERGDPAAALRTFRGSQRDVTRRTSPGRCWATCVLTSGSSCSGRRCCRSCAESCATRSCGSRARGTGCGRSNAPTYW